MDGGTDKCMDKWIHGWMDGSMDTRTHVPKIIMMMLLS